MLNIFSRKTMFESYNGEFLRGISRKNTWLKPFGGKEDKDLKTRTDIFFWIAAIIKGNLRNTWVAK